MSRSEYVVKKQILIVASDESEIARFSALLRAENYVITYCPDITTSQTQLKSQAISVVLINAEVCKPTVGDIASALRVIRPSLKIAALSGFAHRAIIAEAKAMGAIDAVAQKTANDDEFLHLIGSFFKAECAEQKARYNNEKAVTMPPALPGKSLLHDLEGKYPGILTGSWSKFDTFSHKARSSELYRQRS